MKTQSNVDHAKLGRLISQGYSLKEAFAYSGGEPETNKKTNLSLSTLRTVYENTCNWLDSKERKAKIREVLKDDDFVHSFIDDLKSDIKLMSNDFPELVKRYRTAVKELSRILIN